jgi:uncharacterized protein (TIGR02391 family)
VSAVEKIPVFDLAITQGIANILAQTAWPGLSNSEIDDLLQMTRIRTREEGRNKRDSLYRTLHNTQVRQSCGNAMSGFVARSMSPARYANDPNRLVALRDQLDEFLVFYGYRVQPATGRLALGTKARNAEDAAALAGRLHTELRRRGTHNELFRYCAEEFITRSLFHAMSEAAKSIPTRVRGLTGLTGDGQALYDGVFGSQQNQPLLLINDYGSDSDVSEHRGFKNLLVGIHGHYRNPRAHSTRLDSSEQQIDFYDAFGLFSYVHRRLDQSHR